jgi:hypothetical protein
MHDDGVPRPGEEPEEIVDGEIVPDEGSVSDLLPADFIPFPCHHGCTCGLHGQVVYGDRVPLHPPEVLDHGEMALLTEAMESATRRLNDYHLFLSRQREIVIRTRHEAERRLDGLKQFVVGGEALRAHAALKAVQEHQSGLSVEDRRGPPVWMKVALVGAVLGVGLFDAVFFQQSFLDILQITRSDPWWKRGVGLIAAVILAIGLVSSGRILAGPIWRLARRWRQAPSPDEQPPRRALVVARAVAVLAAPGMVLFVLGYWASLRGQIAAADTAVVPGPLPVMLLLLCLTLTVIILEVLVYQPYHADLREAERRFAKMRRKVLQHHSAVRAALTELEIAWRGLRSGRDEVIALVRAELARPWHTVILPARLRHGRAGPVPAAPVVGEAATGPGLAEPAHDDRVDLIHRIFEGVDQPQPGAGPLAETIRSVRELDPQGLRNRYEELRDALDAQLGETSEDETPKEMAV